MTKHLTITAKIALPDDHFDQAETIVAGRRLKEAVEAAVAEHLPAATVAHEIVSDEPPPPVKPARKPRAAKVSGPPVGPAFDPMKADAQPEKTEAPEAEEQKAPEPETPAATTSHRGKRAA